MFWEFLTVLWAYHNEFMAPCYQYAPIILEIFSTLLFKDFPKEAENVKNEHLLVYIFFTYEHFLARNSKRIEEGLYIVDT